MIRTYLILFIAIFFSSCKKNEPDSIQFSGIYVTNCDYKGDSTGSKRWLRFFPNGKVASTLTICEANPEDLKKWFNLETDNKNFNIGNYAVNGEKIDFTFVGKNGSIKYSGILKNGAVDVKWKIASTGYYVPEIYHFAKFKNNR
jgi:hypothetical protein